MVQAANRDPNFENYPYILYKLSLREDLTRELLDLSYGTFVTSRIEPLPNNVEPLPNPIEPPWSPTERL